MYPQYIGSRPIYHNGNPIVINHKPETIDSELNKYITILGSPILDIK